MRVFLINLDKDVVKFASMDSQLTQMGVAYERIPGVLGKNLSPLEIRRSFNSFRWWCAIGRAVSAAEIGCALSHYKIYQRMVDENITVACILEDDVVIDSRFQDQIKNLEKFLGQSEVVCSPIPRVVLLSNQMGIKFQNNTDDFVVRKSSSGMCTDGYCLNKAAAKALLKANLPICVPCDTWGRWVRSRTIELYHALPSVVRQNQERFGSSTSANRQAVAEMPVMRWLAHKGKRVIGRSIDFALSCIVKR